MAGACAGRDLYDRLNCACGETENRIKEQHLLAEQRVFGAHGFCEPSVALNSSEQGSSDGSAWIACYGTEVGTTITVTMMAISAEEQISLNIGVIPPDEVNICRYLGRRQCG